MLLVHLGFSKKALLAAKRGNYNLPDWYINHVKPLCSMQRPAKIPYGDFFAAFCCILHFSKFCCLNGKVSVWF